jgi:glucokinase
MLGIDVGATKIAIGLVDERGVVSDRHEIPTQVASSEILADDLAVLIRRVMAKSPTPITAAGIGSAGPIDVDKGTISPVNISIWRHFQIVALVKKLTGLNKVTLIGDVVALALGEYQLGSARHSKNILGLVVSTGIGGGLILNGQVHNGSSWNAGFIGHTVIGDSYTQCFCGGIGCIEALSSGPSMTRWAITNGLDIPGDSKFEAVAEAAKTKNPIAIEAIRLGTDSLAIAIANAAALLDLDCVVLGGGVAESGEVFWKPLQEAFSRRSAHNKFLKVKAISRCELGKDAGLIGAALYATL